MEYTKEQLWRIKHNAPELYEALKWLVEDEEFHHFGLVGQNLARQALAKVESK